MKRRGNLVKYLTALFVIVTSCTPKAVEVSSVSLNTSTVEMVEGDTYSLVATVLPNNAEYDGISWASSNTSVASVNQGTVTALKEGKTTITASAGGKSATCSVTVSAKYIAVTSITLDKSEMSLKVGSSDVITVTVKPDDATDKNVQWSSSDATIVNVDNGKVTALKSGTATITATAGNCSAECVVKASIDTESITLDKSEISLSVGETTTLTATITPADATDQDITWTSSNPDVASVENGTVKALKAGTATIAAECSGKKAECKVTVTVPVSGISLDKSELYIAIGESTTLTAKITPADATDKTVTWTSSNEEIVKVNDGIVKGIQAGTATITASNSSFSASCIVTVTMPDNIITYTSTDGTVVTPYNSYAFGANIVSNEYTDGVGIIVFDGPVTKIGNYAFKSSKIKTIRIPNSVSEIGNEAFMKTKLESINLPELVSSIGHDAFRYCNSLNDITTPEKLRNIGYHAFLGAHNLKQISLNKGLQTIGAGALNGTGITKIIIPGSVTSDSIILIDGSIIDSPWLGDCDKLQIVEFEEGFTGIPYRTFDGCKSLTDVYFPSTLTKFTSAFPGCVNLTNVYLKSTTPPDNWRGQSEIKNYFSDSGNVTIWVPMSAVETYKNDDVWGYWADRIKGYDFD